MGFYRGRSTGSYNDGVGVRYRPQRLENGDKARRALRRARDRAGGARGRLALPEVTKAWTGILL